MFYKDIRQEAELKLQDITGTVNSEYICVKNKIEVLKNNGYEGMLYSSKNYLEKVWNTNKFSNVWLAHYTSKTDYSGDYSIWQMCNTGKINGINGDVDIDIFYK